jgi:hypothetical protein
LTSSQIEEMSEQRASGDIAPERIKLSRKQRATLRAETGKNPAFFYFYDVLLGENDCTCNAANRALRFSETQAEIPHWYLVSDKEAKALDADFDLMLGD